MGEQFLALSRGSVKNLKTSRGIIKRLSTPKEHLDNPLDADLNGTAIASA
ncbi:MAG: hypothetical protein AAGM29_08335 [Cyanobacteria bacterium J06588_4]